MRSLVEIIVLCMSALHRLKGPFVLSNAADCDAEPVVESAVRDCDVRRVCF